MKYTRVYLDSMGYELAPNVMASSTLEARLAPLYKTLHIQPGQLESLTGIRERRWWDSGHTNAQGAIDAGRKALASSAVGPSEIGVLIYGGVCRDHIEPATACRVADALGLSPDAEVFDISNACLGVMNGIVAIANMIELGQIRSGMVVSCETAREINDIMIEHMLKNPSMELFKTALATLTGGSGAVALVLTDGSYGEPRRRLLGGAHKAAPQHHALCRWDFNSHNTSIPSQYTETDAVAVQTHGVKLGVETLGAFLGQMNWSRENVDRVICHQIGESHRDSVLRAFDLPLEKDFSTFAYLGNMGTVSLPLTAALAEERGFLQPGHRVGFMGIGSGLNCLMLGWEW